MKNHFNNDGKIANLRKHSLGQRNYALRELKRVLIREFEDTIELDEYDHYEVEAKIAAGWELYKIMLQSKSPDSHELYHAIKEFECDNIIKRNSNSNPFEDHR